MADKYTPERATSGKERLRTWWKKVENNFTKIFGAVSKHIDGTADRHTADMIDYSDTETVKAKLDSTDTKLDTKVDKVSGKSLIDSDVADNLKYSHDRLSFDGEIKATHIQAVAIDAEHGIHCGGDVGVNVGDVFTTRMDDDTGSPVTHYLSEKANSADIGTLSDLTTTDKSSIVAAINEVKSSGGGDVLDNLTYDSTKDIINSSANLLLENSASVAAYNGTFRGDIAIGQLGANKWAYRISPITGFSTSVDVTCTSGNKVHSLANKADSNDVLTKTNTAAFTPTGDYQPATKKYVDDAIKAAIEKYNTEAMALLGED